MPIKLTDIYDVFGNLSVVDGKGRIVPVDYEELKDLRGDATKMVNELGWTPNYTFETMLDEMVEYWKTYYKENHLIIQISLNISLLNPLYIFASHWSLFTIHLIFPSSI